MKYLIIANDLSLPLDEGMKKVAYYLSRTISKKAKTLTFSTRGENVPQDVKLIKTNRLFISWHLRQEIIKFEPDRIIYVSKFTFFSFLRTIIIKNYYNKSKVIMLALMDSVSNKYIYFLINLILKFVSIDLIITPSNILYKNINNKNYIKISALGVNINKFRPIDSESKFQLRKKYNLDNGKFIVLHVGHLTKYRNLETLLQIQDIDGVQVLVVCSESQGVDENLLNKLNKSKIKLISKYIENMEEIYQLADCYIFPSNSRYGAIHMPLSILEAMACNLPVVTTKFGSLPTFFKEEGGLFYFDSIDEIIEKIHKVCLMNEICTRKFVETYTWEKLIQSMEEEL